MKGLYMTPAWSRPILCLMVLPGVRLVPINPLPLHDAPAANDWTAPPMIQAPGKAPRPALQLV